MDFLNDLLRIGVIIAIFRFIWFFIQMLMFLLVQGRNGTVHHYFMRGLKYFFLGQVLPLFCVRNTENLELHTGSLIITALVFILYLVGKMQQQQRRMVRFQFMSGNQMQNQQAYHFGAEIGILLIGVASIVFFSLYPEFNQNKISMWFYEQILSLEKASIIGWIFKLVGFFFVISIIQQFVYSVMQLAGLGKRNNDDPPNDSSSNTDSSDDGFVDYEEVK